MFAEHLAGKTGVAAGDFDFEGKARDLAAGTGPDAIDGFLPLDPSLEQRLRVLRRNKPESRAAYGGAATKLVRSANGM